MRWQNENSRQLADSLLTQLGRRVDLGSGTPQELIDSLPTWRGQKGCTPEASDWVGVHVCTSTVGCASRVCEGQNMEQIKLLPHEAPILSQSLKYEPV
jgi:hypothetical protein